MKEAVVRVASTCTSICTIQSILILDVGHGAGAVIQYFLRPQSACLHLSSSRQSCVPVTDRK